MIRSTALRSSPRGPSASPAGWVTPEHAAGYSSALSTKGTVSSEIFLNTNCAPNNAVEFEFNLMKNTKDVMLIKNFEECVGLTDEHLGLITNLNFSPYKAEFEEQINSLYEGMGIVAEVMEVWIKLQVSYM